ncbi:MAG: hypothetical protein A3D50_02195 [Candidatus Taylorbacteria bacterium RIFCSPHIGHO2_02_FULL_44_12]|uniref:LamG-like jellyroll fold domain-containing protein n=1 Tax=Candidatus Taylorbacteria bacterium RIFCSPHIGHO2_02_FULL_44_12 TaxID=1802308 RepID=A0A1G2MK64_9BACT|nr:MAG: hypothetical protein A3D50_02195 [Candidatus Taylorbacteria bacterium RIFCSPHIGHO2_02_FULL_44_12]
MQNHNAKLKRILSPLLICCFSLVALSFTLLPLAVHAQDITTGLAPLQYWRNVSQKFFTEYIAIPSARAQTADIVTGLIGHWKFDETSGTMASDSSGNNNTGTLTNGPTWTTGKIGGALNFDGVDDYVDMGIGSATESIGGGSAVSVSLWIKINDPNNTADKMIISKFQNAASKSTWNLIKDNIAQGNNLYFQVWNTAGADVVATSDNLFPTDANWHHVVGVYDGSRVYIYGDGVSIV